VQPKAIPLHQWLSLPPQEMLARARIPTRRKLLLLAAAIQQADSAAFASRDLSRFEFLSPEAVGELPASAARLLALADREPADWHWREMQESWVAAKRVAVDVTDFEAAARFHDTELRLARFRGDRYSEHVRLLCDGWVTTIAPEIGQIPPTTAWVEAVDPGRNERIRHLVAEVLLPSQRPVGFDRRWRSSDVLGLGKAVYEDTAFERLPLLGDALMDAGCDDELILGHCRSQGLHVRGCWVVDLALGKD
jgi:hypothetical protein